MKSMVQAAHFYLVIEHIIIVTLSDWETKDSAPVKYREENKKLIMS